MLERLYNMLFKKKWLSWSKDKTLTHNTATESIPIQPSVDIVPNKVGVVLPVYNQEKEYLIECILALESQTYKNFSLVIVIDGANKETVNAVFEVSKLLTCDFSIINRPVNKGIAYSLNEGFNRLLDCPYLTWISSDNRQAPNFLERLVQTMNTSSPDTVLVYSMYNPIDKNGLPHPSVPAFYPALYNMMNRSKEEIVVVSFIGASFLFTREGYEKAGGYDSSYGVVSDYEFWIRLSQHGGFIFLPEALMDYRYNGKHSLTTLTPTEELYLQSMKASIDHRIKGGDIPSVTVIITAHNHGKYIKQCIDSVLNQTFQNFHIVVLDVGSSDKTFDQIYSAHDTRLIPIHIKKRTKAEALNIALEYALGKYVLELDGDDWIEPNTLEVMVTEMESLPPKVGMAYANRKLWFEENDMLVEGDVYKGLKYKDKSEVLEKFQTHCPRMYRLSTLRELNGWTTNIDGEPLLAEDYMMFLRVAEQFKIHWIDQTLYNQRRHNTNITILQKEQLNRQFRQIVEKMLNKWGNKKVARFSETNGYITEIILEERRGRDKK